MAMTDRFDRTYTARDVHEMAGLSYRQLNVWAARGVLPGDHSRGAGWRRFSGRELFVLMVCVEIRRLFGVPVGRLRTVHSAMLHDNSDHFDTAARLIAKADEQIWLVTDLDEIVELTPESEVVAFTRKHLRAGDAPQGFLWVKLNALVKRLLTRLQQDQIPSSLRRALSEPSHDFTPCSPEESEIIQCIRSGEFAKIEVLMKNGVIKTIRTDRHVTRPDQQDLTDLVRQHDFQTITLTRRDGRIVSIDQTVPMKKGRSRS
jgi:DNA-binding transcriptional MerR regulator